MMHLDLPSRQRGSVLIQFAVTFLFIIVPILGIVDLGYAFYAKRDLQRIADLAAIEAVQGIDFQTPDSSESCVAAGTRSVELNWPAPLTPLRKSIVCGEWNHTQYAAPHHFLGNATPLNAAHVVLEGDSPHFIPGPWSRHIRAEAIAQRSESTAAFQIGSQLLKLEKDAPLGRLLTLIGLDADQLTVLDTEGLAKAKITPSGLLKALGVDLGIDGLAALSPEQLLELNQLSLLQVVNASLKVLGDDTLGADVRAVIDVIDDLKIDDMRLLDLKLPLLGDASTGSTGILTFLSLGQDSSPNGAALDTQIGLGALLKTSIMVAAQGHTLQIQETNLLNVAKLGLTVVEPPTIAIGPVGTKAHSAQIRLSLDIDSKELPLLGPVLDLLGLRINLPIKIDGTSADATLNAIYCPDPDRGNKPSIDLGVQSRVAQITIGHPERSASDPENLLIETPLSLDVRGPITADVLEATEESLNLLKNDRVHTQANSVRLGDTVGSLTDAVFNLLGGIFTPVTLNNAWQGAQSEGNAEQALKAQIELLANLYLEESKANGFYNVDAAIDLLLHGRGDEGTDGYMAKLLREDFALTKSIPTTCVLVTCPQSAWRDGTFTESFKAYTSVPYSLLDVVGIPTNMRFPSCAGLLSSLLAWNTCVSSNLSKMLLQHSDRPELNLTDSNALVSSLKNQSTDSVTCSGALCVLLKPILTPVKWLLNGLGEAILSPLLTKVLGLELGRNEVQALDINCNSAQLVY